MPQSTPNGYQSRGNSMSSDAAASSNAAAPGSARSSHPGDRQDRPPQQPLLNGVQPAPGGSAANGAGPSSGATASDWFSRFPPTNAYTAGLTLSSPGEGMGGGISTLYTVVTDTGGPASRQTGYYGQNGSGYGGSPNSQDHPPRFPDGRAGPSIRDRALQPSQGYGIAPSSQSTTYPLSPRIQRPNPTSRSIRDTDDRARQYTNNGRGRRGRYS